MTIVVIGGDAAGMSTASRIARKRKDAHVIVFEKTDIVRIYAEVFAPNAASLRVLEKCGFVREGIKRRSVFKNGEFCDSIVMALIKE